MRKTNRIYDRRKIFYVYALLDPRKPGPFYYGHWKFSHEPFYIGKGKDNRVLSHLSGSAGNNFSKNKIKSIRRSGLEPLYVVKRENLTEKQALTLENKLIISLGRSNLGSGPLTNLTDGWEGGGGVIWSDDMRRKRAKITSNRWANMSDEDRQAFSKKMIQVNIDKKELISRGVRRANENRSYEEKKRISEILTQHNKDTWASRTEEELSIIRKNISEGNKKHEASLTNNQRRRRSKRQSIAQAEWRKNRSQSSIDQERERRSASMKAYWKSIREQKSIRK